MTTAQRRSQDAYGRRRSRYEEAARLRVAAVSISAIAMALGAERKMIRQWLRADGALLWTKPPRGNILTPYQAYLDRRWAEGCRNASLLWREVAEVGFAGRPGVVLHWAKARREKTSRVSKPEIITVPSAWFLAWLVMANPEGLPKVERSLVLHLLDQVTSLADTITVAKRLNGLLRRKASGSLDAVLDAADRTPLKEFAAAVRHEVGAIQAALDLPWTISPSKGR